MLGGSSNTLTSSHFYDCNGAACDAPTLQPWELYKYSFAPQYAPQEPPGGVGEFGESLWLVGAASDALSTLLGPDDSCCGREDAGRGGCGKCIIVRAAPHSAAARNVRINGTSN